MSIDCIPHAYILAEWSPEGTRVVIFDGEQFVVVSQDKSKLMPGYFVTPTVNAWQQHWLDLERLGAWQWWQQSLNWPQSPPGQKCSKHLSIVHGDKVLLLDCINREPPEHFVAYLDLFDALLRTSPKTRCDSMESEAAMLYWNIHLNALRTMRGQGPVQNAHQLGISNEQMQAQVDRLAAWQAQQVGAPARF